MMNIKTSTSKRQGKSNFYYLKKIKHKGAKRFAFQFSNYLRSIENGALRVIPIHKREATHFQALNEWERWSAKRFVSLCLKKLSTKFGGLVLKKKGLGGVLLSRTLVHSTIGDEGLDFRVRNGVGYFPLSIATKLN